MNNISYNRYENNRLHAHASLHWKARGVHSSFAITRLEVLLLAVHPAAQVREVAQWLAERAASSAQRLQYEIGTVTRVEPVGMGDRYVLVGTSCTFTNNPRCLALNMRVNRNCPEGIKTSCATHCLVREKGNAGIPYHIGTLACSSLHHCNADSLSCRGTQRRHCCPLALAAYLSWLTHRRDPNCIAWRRVCVDTASLLRPGEGLLVGNFARAMFLVHSECAQSAYISSRPFRVNAGPVNPL